MFTARASHWACNPCHLLFPSVVSSASVPITMSTPDTPSSTPLRPTSPHSEVITASLVTTPRLSNPSGEGVYPGEAWKERHKPGPLRKRESSSSLHVGKTCGSDSHNFPQEGEGFCWDHYASLPPSQSALLWGRKVCFGLQQRVSMCGGGCLVLPTFLPPSGHRSHVVS